MRVTAVIPVHNHARWVGEALASVTSQDHRPLRAVVVDDGSKDGSHLAVLDALSDVRQVGAAAWTGSQNGVAVLVLRHEAAKGPAAARNTGIRAGREGTDLFALLDSDDLYEPGKIAASVAAFEAAGEACGLVYTDFSTFGGNVPGLFRQWKEPFSLARLERECIVNCDSVVSAKAVETVGGFCEELRVCEDYDLWLRIAERFMCVHVPEALVRVRVGSHSSTDSVPKARWNADYAKVFTRLEERRADRRHSVAG